MLTIKIYGLDSQIIEDKAKFITNLESLTREKMRTVISRRSIFHFIGKMEDLHSRHRTYFPDITCEIQYDPLPDMTSEVMQGIAQAVGESVQESLKGVATKPAIRVHTKKTDILNEGIWRSTSALNAVKAIKEDTPKEHRIFYSNDHAIKHHLHFLLRAYLQTEKIKTGIENPYYKKAEEIVNSRNNELAKRKGKRKKK